MPYQGLWATLSGLPGSGAALDLKQPNQHCLAGLSTCGKALLGQVGLDHLPWQPRCLAQVGPDLSTWKSSCQAPHIPHHTPCLGGGGTRPHTWLFLERHSLFWKIQDLGHCPEKNEGGPSWRGKPAGLSFQGVLTLATADRGSQ